jgi:phosphatidate phosphatase APP1
MRTLGTIISVWVIALYALSAFGATAPAVSTLQADAVVVFYPSYLKWDPQTEMWRGAIHGKVHEPSDSVTASVTLAALRQAWGIGHDLTDEEKRMFKQRSAGFRVDNERGKQIVVQIGEQQFVSARSKPTGQFAVEVELDRAGVEEPVEFTVMLEAEDQRQFGGDLQLLAAEGLSVISDIDDTVKDSNVLDTSELMANTFLRPFKAIEGMAQLYAGWDEQGAAIHYVTATPIQLYEPLWEFLIESGFPGVEIRLRPLRLRDSSFFDFFGESQDYKKSEIREILGQLPRRQFVLVGDSGEHDPAVYATIARECPEQVQGIFIRAVLEKHLDRARYNEIFEGIEDSKWVIFADPGALPGDLADWVKREL